jgi:soluble lytic murein transglycosylase-like protein
VARDQEAPDGFLLVSLFAAESGFDPKAVNPVTGARGLGQVMPASASEAVLGWQRVARGEQVDPRRLDDPAFNLRVALKILAGFRARCGTWPETIGAYNGSGCRRTEFAARVWQRYLEIRPAVLASR